MKYDHRREQKIENMIGAAMFVFIGAVVLFGLTGFVMKVINYGW